MIYKEEGLILSVESLSQKLFRLKINSPVLSHKALPGNFCHLRVNPGYSPLLRRAFSFHEVVKEKNYFGILFKVVGPGTKLLSLKNPGDRIDLIAPLGNTFSLPNRKEYVILLAGGMGIAPLSYLLSYLLKKKFNPEKITLFYGAKNKEELILLKELTSAGINLHITTENGSLGFKGTITTLFDQELKESRVNPKSAKFYGCGPNPMLKKISQISRKFNLRCQVSLENHMPCGVGACMGCVVKSVNGFKRVCKDGPVFNARELIWD